MGFLPAMVRIIEIFKKFDKNNDGVISKQARRAKTVKRQSIAWGYPLKAYPATAKPAPKWSLFDESGRHGNPRS